MKPAETVSTPHDGTHRRNHRPYRYQKVLDSRKQPIRGLWKRNGRFIARITIEGPDGGKLIRWKPLENAKTVAEAQAALRKVLTDREQGKPIQTTRAPKLSEAVQRYMERARTLKEGKAKRESTIIKEEASLDLWLGHFGDIRIDRINKSMVNQFTEKRIASGMSARTANLDVIALRSVVKLAINEDKIVASPVLSWQPLDYTPKKRGLFTPADIQKLCDAAMKESKNGQQFCDYVRLMAYCGSRRDETLRLRWSDVDWRNRQLTIGSDGLAKNHKARAVDFNEQLEAHLKQMLTRKVPDSEWLFPSPQRGDRDASTKTFKETLTKARKASGVQLQFHDCRHFFISMCVMSGIDYMTIARWAGHQDGGVLIGKVYGHLSNEHAQAQAARLNFGPAIVRLAQSRDGVNHAERPLLAT
jgi:integrase